jgi:hypothetical protein
VPPENVPTGFIPINTRSVAGKPVTPTVGGDPGTNDPNNQD